MNILCFVGKRIYVKVSYFLESNQSLIKETVKCYIIQQKTSPHCCNRKVASLSHVTIIYVCLKAEESLWKRKKEKKKKEETRNQFCVHKNRSLTIGMVRRFLLLQPPRLLFWVSCCHYICLCTNTSKLKNF